MSFSVTMQYYQLSSIFFMRQYQRGEIATIVAFVTFVVIGAVTVVSTLINTSSERRTSNTQASEACWATKGNTKGKACDIPECNATLGGNPGNCPACNGGWCEGGFCRTCGNKPPEKALPTAVNTEKNAPKDTSCQPNTKKGEYCDEFSDPNKSFIVETWYSADCKEEFRVTDKPCGKSAGGNTQPPPNGGQTNPPQNQQPPPQEAPQQPPSTGDGQPEQPQSQPEDPPQQQQPPQQDAPQTGDQQNPPPQPQAAAEKTCAVYVSVFDGDKRLPGATVRVKRGNKVYSATTDTGGYIRTNDNFTKGEIEVSASANGYESATKTDTIDPSASCSTAITLTKKGTGGEAVVCTGEYNRTFAEAQTACSNGYTQNPTKTTCYKCNAAPAGNTGNTGNTASLTCNNCKISCGSDERVDSSRFCAGAGQVCCGPREAQGPPAPGTGATGQTDKKCNQAYCDTVSKQVAYFYTCPNNASCAESSANKWYRKKSECEVDAGPISNQQRISWCNAQPRTLRFEAIVDASGLDDEFSEEYHRAKGKPIIFEIRASNHATIAKFEIPLDEFLARGKKLSAFSEVYANKAGDLGPDIFGNERSFYAVLTFAVPHTAERPYKLRALPSDNVPMNWNTSKLTIEYTVK